VDRSATARGGRPTRATTPFTDGWRPARSRPDPAASSR
jgi:hypothetical protein